MGKINGLCVSKGNAIGKICVVDSRYSEKALTDTTILVMKALDRKLLVNLNKKVVGVIAEIGNIGSHGAGILRHLKIPCILRIKNAMEIFKDGEIVELCGMDGSISFGGEIQNRKYEIEPSTEYGKMYSSISSEKFDLTDIQVNQSWYCARPDRPYQRLRYDIIKEVFVMSANFLFGLPPAKIKQNQVGAITTLGAPNTLDICKYILKNPSWLVIKAKERSQIIDNIKLELCKLNQLPQTIDGYVAVFEKGIELYRNLFKYSLMSQAISDELLDAYTDFVSMITGKRVSRDILNLKSLYVENCINSGIDPGVSQKWKVEKAECHIWNGSISFEPLCEDEEIIDKINFKNNFEKLKMDYDSFRIIVPLVYQLSEEFFYISSSINSYINWSLVQICNELNKKLEKKLNVEDLYEMSIEDLFNMINKNKGE